MNPKEGKEGEKKKKKRSNRKQKYDSYNIYIYRSVWCACYIYNYIKFIWTKQSNSNEYQTIDFF